MNSKNPARVRGRISRWTFAIAACAALHALSAASAENEFKAFISKHCTECHDADSHKGNLDLTALKMDFSAKDEFKRWVKVLDLVKAGDMPPRKRKERPSADEIAAVMPWLHSQLHAADVKRLAEQDRTAVRRLTRVEYENTIRDLFDMPGILLKTSLPFDGSIHGFDKNSDALDISHVNMSKYLEAADHTLDLAIATQPQPPVLQKKRISMARHCGHILGNGDGVLLRDMKPDPEFPPAGETGHIDEGAHQRVGSFDRLSTVGLFRHEDESFKPYFYEFSILYPGKYKLRTSLWSFQWDKGQVLPSRGTEVARLSVVQLQGDGRGGDHPSYVLGYYDAPSLQPTVHELETHLNFKDVIGFNTSSLAPVANYSRKGRAMAFTGPGIACDWLDIEGPIHDVWPPRSHKLLFGELPIQEFVAKDRPNVKAPLRKAVRQETQAPNRPDPVKGIWTVESTQPLVDADKLLATFLPKAFRRPVSDAVRKQYVERVDERLKVGHNFEAAMRWAYRAALCSPDFLYHVEPTGPLDDYALASRLSYFFWNSMPDDELISLAKEGRLKQPDILRAQTERLLKDPKSKRFTEEFTAQWLKLRNIATNDPDRKLYPEFNNYLQDSMVAETRAYFREMIDQNLDMGYIVKSDFAMLNQKLAVHYGIPGVVGHTTRRVPLPPDSARGPFLTQASILKITANGTTTSPVPRGAFVLEKILGQHPEPPPPNIAAVEPDVRGAATIRELLDKHRNNASCASCHATIDPPGFALESFDVIGGQRDRYRSLEKGDSPPRGSIDPFIGIGFKLGPKVDASGETSKGEKFANVQEFQGILASDKPRLLKNMAEQFTVYATGREISYSEREEIAALVARTQRLGGGMRTLLHEVVQSPLFRKR
jgi:mono/diheme cytochrome c family protein